jgi:hypothetical protein
MVVYRATGKYDSDDVTRDQFYLGKRRVLVTEAIEAPEETFSSSISMSSTSRKRRSAEFSSRRRIASMKSYAEQAS